MPSSVLDEVSAVRWEPVLSAQLRSWGMREKTRSQAGLWPSWGRPLLWGFGLLTIWFSTKKLMEVQLCHYCQQSYFSSVVVISEQKGL